MLDRLDERMVSILEECLATPYLLCIWDWLLVSVARYLCSGESQLHLLHNLTVGAQRGFDWGWVEGPCLPS